MADADEVMGQALAVEAGELPSGSVVVALTGERSLSSPGFGFTPLCEEDPDEPGWCAYHREQHNPYDDAAGLEAADLVDGDLSDLEDAVRTLNVHAMGLGAIDFDQLVALLDRLQLIRGAVQTLEAGFVAAIWKAKGDRYGDVEVPDLGVVSIRRGAKRNQWDHDGAASAVVDAHMEATGGEAPDPGEVKRWLLDAAGIGYWRKGALTDLGVDVDDYCHTEPGKPGVQITRASSENPLLTGGAPE